jgi:redox-sensitive bicupin YhaK (pirin superfamily)
MRGFQLWMNLPARDKMQPPNYQEFGGEKIPVVERAGLGVKVIAGELDGVTGPVQQPATSPIYFDVRIDAGVEFVVPVPRGHSGFVYVYEGALQVGIGREAASINAQELAVLGDGDEIRLAGRAPQGKETATRAIVVAGRPLREPVARYGPFVMNTREEIQQAFADFQAGKF